MIFSKVKGKHFSVKENSVFGNKGLFISCISLCVLISMFFSISFSWFMQKDIVNINTGAVTVTATAGMRVNNGEDLSGIVKLATGVKLAEASSVDGRNMFFPTTGTFSDDTSKMVFREGNAGDRNVNYFYKDFSLKSDSGDTDVYVKSYTVKVGNITYDSATQNETVCPIRIAFILDSEKDPILIDPTARFGEYTHTYNAVDSIDENGSATTKKSVPAAFMQYYFAAGKPAFTIEENKELKVTMVMWLEGTGGNCDKFVGKNVSVDINFESNWDYMDVIEFVDNTVGDRDASVKHWVNNDECLVTLTYFDTKTNQNKTVMMTKDAKYDENFIWRAAIPQGITTYITFNRYNPKSDVVWNAWYTEPNVNNIYYNQKDFNPDLQESRIVEEGGVTYRCFRYEALGGNGKEIAEAFRPYPCRGYWRVVENTPVVDNNTSEEVITSIWSLSGTFNNWSTNATDYQFITTNTEGVYTIKELTLASGTYQFKVHQTMSSGETNWYANSGFKISDIASNIELDNNTSNNNMVLTASGGKYTFTIDVRGGTVKLTITAVLDGNEEIPDTDFVISVTINDNTVNPNKDYGWVYANVKDYSLTLNIVFDNGTRYPMSMSDINWFRTENVPASSKTKIKGFVLVRADGSVTHTFTLSSSVEVKNYECYNFEINSENKLILTN